VTTYSKAGTFVWAGGGKAGATVDMWLASRFTGFPAENQAPPSGSPDAGPVTTGTTYGSPGGFNITGITTIADYYIRVQYGGNTYWAACSANDLLGAPVASGVTAVSVVSANGLAGTVANPNTTPAITLETTVTGLLKGNGTAVAAATAGTDYLAPTGNGSGLTGITNSQVSGSAPLASPALTGTPTAPTASAGTNTTQVATSAFVSLNTIQLTGESGFLTGSPPAVGSGPFFQQCGAKSGTTSGFNIAVTFPTAFPNGVASILITPTSVLASTSATTWTFNVAVASVSGFTLETSLSTTIVGFSWFAIGF